MLKIGSELEQKLAAGDMELFLADTIASIFDGQSDARLPKFLVDIACGDGQLLEKLSLAVGGQRRKASALANHSMTFIGFDTDKNALHEVSVRINNPSTILLEGDWRNPWEIIDVLSKKGIADLRDVLFIGNLFAFHKTEIWTENPDISEAVGKPSKVADGLASLGSWAPYLSDSSMLLHVPMEEGAPPAHGGANHSLLLRMAQEGLFVQAAAAEDLDGVESISNGIQRITRYDYRIRIACADDLNALVELEELCWAPGQRATASDISERILQCPEGQLVLELDGAVAAVIYSQRLATEDVHGVQSTNAHRLHLPNGPIVHVLSLNVLPKYQNRSLGDQLLEFMLQYSAAMDGVHTVIGVTRCNDYSEHAHTKLEDYIHMRNERGRLVDTVLRMHQLHGAEVVRLVPEYRPADVVNNGYGVLARYRLRGRKKRITLLNASNLPNGPAIQDISNELENLLSSAVAASLKIDGVDAVALDRPLFELGLDSAGLMDLKERIGNMFGVSLGPTFLFEHNTCEKIAAYLRRQATNLTAGDVPEQTENNQTENSPAEITVGASSSGNTDTKKFAEKDVAIIGIACRLPGGILDADGLWHNLERATFAVSELPDERWNWPSYIHPDSEHPGIAFGGFLDDVVRFDASFFRISPKEAELMDPQQRILLELSWQCLENAGYAKRSLSGSRTGVFVGASGSDYQLRQTERHAEIDAYFGLGTSMAVLANRLSYFYDWNGPSVQIDTACSSSLVAVHDAVKALRNGECAQALVAGINIMCHPATTIAYYKAGMLSREGKCRTFDQGANGYVRGEGAVVLLLKPLARAIEDRDHVYAVIKGSAVNHGGQAAGLTVPNPTQQSELLNQAYADAAIDPGTVGYIETHGTGTPLGDPIEVQGLNRAFQKRLSSSGASLQYYCGLGSIKTNIGHLEAAAGIAGLLKAALCLKHGKLPATLHFDELNPHISLHDSPFYVVDRPRLWQPAPGEPLRRAGVSSFGSGGTNAHIVLEEYGTEAQGKHSDMRSSDGASSSYLFVLSAKDPDRLKDRVKDLTSHIRDLPLPEYGLRDLAYTLQIGRDPMECRLAIEASSIEELVKKLEAFQHGQHSLEGIHYRQIKLGAVVQTSAKELRASAAERAPQSMPGFHDLLQSWLAGEEADWESLWPDGQPDRVPLPAYRFAGKTYWLGSGKKAAPKGNEAIAVNEKTVSLAPCEGRSISIESMPKKITLRPLTEAVEEFVTHSQDGSKTHLSEPAKVRLTKSIPDDARQESDFGHETPNKFAMLDKLRQQLAASLAEALFLDVDEILPDEQFSDMGLDSISGVEWVRAINRQYGISIQATMVYAYPNIRALSAYILELLGDSMNDQCAEPKCAAVDHETETALCSATSISISDIRAVLTENLARALYMEPDEIHPDEQFTDMGLDSISGVEWVRAINRHYGAAIPATMVYAYPNISAFANYLATQLKIAQPATLPATPERRSNELEDTKQTALPRRAEQIPPAERPSEGPAPTGTSSLAEAVHKRNADSAIFPAGGKFRSNENAVAIVGMSGRYPGASNLEQYWANLRAGKDAVVEIPPVRWDIAKYYDPRPFQRGKINSKWLGFLGDVDRFDAAFFGIPPAEAELMDPQHRIFLEEAYQAIVNAGYGGIIAENLRCGVYLGISNNEYAHIQRSSHLAFADRIGNSQAIAAARISYFLNLQGPALPVDTACSSSLVATHLAYRALVTKEVDMAVAGGVSLYLTPELYINLSASGLLSADGKCKTFDNGANGIVPGEGVGALVLKRLEDAEADGDMIHGVIIASGINQDGRTNGITAPSMIRQTQLIQEVYRQYGIDPASISYVEAHGTGTKLGDPVELEALATAFKTGARRAERCAIGSVKSNIGHTSAAAGLAGIHKVLLSMQHKELPPSLHFNKQNEHFDFEHSPLVVNSTLVPWNPALGRRRAAVSSFGLSGTNAHLVIEEYLPQHRQNDIHKNTGAPALFVLSAMSEEQLKFSAETMRFHIERHTELMPVEIAYTLQVSRRAMEWRLAFVASSRSELLDCLAAIGRGEPKPGLFIGKAGGSDKSLSIGANNEEARTLLRGWMANGQLDKLAKHWVDGVDVDWRALHVGEKPIRVRLPGYSFARERFWIPASSAPAIEAAGPVESPVEQKPDFVQPVLVSAATSAMLRTEPETAFSSASSAVPEISELVQLAQEWLATAALRLVKSTQNEIDPETELSEYGFDSIGFTQFCSRINEAFQISLTPTIFFEFPTLHQLAVYLGDSHADNMAHALGAAPRARSGAEPVLPKKLVAASIKSDEPAPPVRFDGRTENLQVAVVGMSGCFPMAENLDAFWRNLLEGKDCISEVPPGRWDWRAIYGDATKEPNKTKVKWAGFIDGVDEFDPLFFGIAPREAELMDPQQRLLMTYAWKAIEDAGYSGQSLSGSNAAIFVGTGGSGYGRSSATNADVEGSTTLGRIMSLGPSRLSYFLDLHGPSEPVETACSSALVAIHKGLMVLADGSCDMVIAGGVNTLLTSEPFISLSKAGMLAEDGRCKTFSKDANGYARGEGVGMLVLKRLSDAERDGDHIYGVIRGSAENHGGRAQSLTAPNPKAQADLLKAAYARAGVDPTTVTYIEAHGTGTPLGDPIEVNALKSVFAERSHDNQSQVSNYCGLGSVKTNIGHLELAAGAAGVIKVLLQMQHKTLVKSLHSEVINPYIELKDSPFYIVQEAREWQALKDEQGRELPRRAGVSSFGFGGVNAHVVIEEYVARPGQQPAIAISAENPALVVLSARNGERLKEQVAQLLAWLQERQPDGRELAEVAYTLQVGREAMEERLAVMAGSTEELVQKLKAYAGGENHIDDLYRGQVKRNKDALRAFMADKEMGEKINAWIFTRMFGKLLDLWVKGLVFDWSKLYGEHKPRRISLPTYPFAKERYWVLDEKQSPFTSTSISNDVQRSENTMNSDWEMIQATWNDTHKEHKFSNTDHLTNGLHDTVSDISLRSNAELPEKPSPLAAPFMDDNADESSAIAIDTERFISQLVADKLGTQPGSLDSEASYFELGLSSVDLLSMVDIISKKVNATLPPTLLFEYPTISDLSIYLASNHGESFAPQSAEIIKATLKDEITNLIKVASESIPRVAANIEQMGNVSDSLNQEKQEKKERNDVNAVENVPDIAIIGLSGRFPGAEDIHEFWENLRDGKDSVVEIPRERWDHSLYFDESREKPGKSYCKWGGFIDGIEEFDPLFFHISPAHARFMDPHERLFLQAIWELLESTGYSSEILQEKHQGKVGVYAGASSTSVTSNSAIVNRVSHFFGLKGPSIAVETMCSSFATALHIACKDLMADDCEMAIVGGVNLLLDPQKNVFLCQTQILGSHAQSRSFGDGDGYLPGEAVGAVLLKRLPKAINDKDNILAVIKGVSISHSGRGNAYLVPDLNAQAQLIEQNLTKVGADPRTINYVEAAANGSKLGDPIELAALTKVFGKYTNHQKFCPIGSVKSNIGHAEVASGFAQLTKVVLQMQRRQLVPSIMASPLNPNIRFDGTPFYLQQELQEWMRPVVNVDGVEKEFPRRALINSFAAGGSYASLVVEEYIPAQPTDNAHADAAADTKRIIVLSAPSRKKLREVAQRLCAYIEASDEQLKLADLAYTLQVRRTPMDCRLALVVENMQELQIGLNQYLSMEDEGLRTNLQIPIYYSDIETSNSDFALFCAGKEGEAIIQILLKTGNLERLALMWVRGAAIPWKYLNKENEVSRVVYLPTYPFAKERYRTGIKRIDNFVASDRHESPVDESLESKKSFSPLTVQEIQDRIRLSLSELLSLDADEISIKKDMRDYGVDSIIGMRLTRDLEQALNVKLPGRELLEYRTVSSLAQHLIKKVDPSHLHENSKNIPCTTDISQEADEGKEERPLIHALSHGQQGLWALQMLTPEMDNYNVPMCLRVSGEIDVVAIKKAGEFLVEQHPALGSVFVQENGRPCQKLHAINKPLFEHVNVSTQDSENIFSWVNEKARIPFSLQSGPLFRMHLFTENPTKHTLLIVVHHIVFDGGSVAPILKSFFDAYEAFLNGRMLKVTTESSYYDFVKWEQKFLSSSASSEHRNYWKQKLSGAHVSLEFNRSAPRPGEAGFDAKTHIGYISDKVGKKINEFAKANNVSPVVFFLAIYKILLHKHTKQEDIIVGMPTIGRPERRFNEVVGYFVNMIALRSAVTPKLFFSDFIKSVQLTLSDGLDHAMYPFPALVRELNVARNSVSSPVFQALFVYQSSNAIRKLLNQYANVLPVSFVAEVHQNASFDIELEVVEGNGDFELHLKYKTNLFQHSTIHQMMNEYLQMVERTIESSIGGIEDLLNLNCSRQISKTEKSHVEECAARNKTVIGSDMVSECLMQDSDQTALIAKWNSTEKPYDQDKCLHQYFEEQVARTPTSIAAIFEDQELTYAELDSRANRVAHYLISRGAKPGVLVGVCMERSLEMIVALLGVLKAGSAYVPIDPEFPEKRVQFLLQDTGAPIVLTQAKQQSGLGEYQGEIVCLDTLWGEIKGEPDERPENAANSSDLAYVIYTSGSTGNPKGCMLPHSAVCNRLVWMQNEYMLDGSDRVLQKTPYSFDVSVWEFFWPLLAGSTIVFAKPGGHKEPRYLIELIESQNITTCHFVPSMLTAFINAVKKGECSTLRRIFTSGEALSYQVLEKFQMKLQSELHNLYGPTEAAVDVTYWKGKLRPDKKVPIGRPIANINIYILDSHLRQTPIGEVGELHIGGVGLARGYLNREDLTREKFIRNPFDKEKKSRLYKTGDLARWLPDGEIEYLGRNDHQVKIRGFRIELGEIEARLREHDDISDATVLDWVDEQGEKSLVAYFIPVSSKTLSVAELRNFIRGSLPEYMTPSAFVPLEKFPLTHSGKLDKKALPTPKASSSSQYVPPRSSTEKRLVEIWKEVLGVDRVGIHDDFFDIGGHSLKAVNLIAQMAESFNGKSISQVDFYNSPTIHAIAPFFASDVCAENEVLPLLKKASGAPTISIICSPYGGGSATVFAPLADALSKLDPGISVYGISIPGNEFGSASNESQPIEELARICVERILRKVEGPIGIYGHCVGSFLALEITRQLELAGRKVEFLIAGAAFPFSRWMKSLPISNPWRMVSNKRIHKLIQSWGGAKEAIHENALKFLISNFRRNVKMALEYDRRRQNWKIKAPVCNVISKDDKLTRNYEERHLRWRQVTDKLELFVLEKGEHYFVTNRPDTVAKLIFDYAFNTHKNWHGQKKTEIAA